MTTSQVSARSRQSWTRTGGGKTAERKHAFTCRDPHISAMVVNLNCGFLKIFQKFFILSPGSKILCAVCVRRSHRLSRPLPSLYMFRYSGRKCSPPICYLFDKRLLALMPLVCLSGCAMIANVSPPAGWTSDCLVCYGRHDRRW